MQIFLFSVGLLLTTAKQLRFFSVIPAGLGEVLILIWIFFSVFEILQKKTIKYHGVVACFEYAFLTLLIMGWLISVLANRNAHNSLYDFLALIFSGLILFFLVTQFNAKEIRLIYFYNSSLFVVLSSLFLGIDTYFSFSSIGFDPWYVNDRFMGWTGNPNQLALFLITIPFINLYLISVSRHLILKIWMIITIILALKLGYLSGSDALYVSWGIAFMFSIPYVTIQFLTKISIKKKLYFFIFTSFLIFNIAIYFTLFFDEFLLLAGTLNPLQVSQAPVRINLILNGWQALWSFPVFGLGPGSHAGLEMPFQGIEAHNTFLDLATNTGFLGLLGFLLFLNFIFKKVLTTKSIWLVTAFLALMCFVQFHYVFRQPWFWFSLMGLAKLSEIKPGKT